jgi:hypothetical protein
MGDTVRRDVAVAHLFGLAVLLAGMLMIVSFVLLRVLSSGACA